MVKANRNFRFAFGEENLKMPADETVTNPSHYRTHPSGVECIDIAESMTFNLGNAIKYIWRAGLKGDAVTDLRKAAWYINREIDRLTVGNVSEL